MNFLCVASAIICNLPRTCHFHISLMFLFYLFLILEICVFRSVCKLQTILYLYQWNYQMEFIFYIYNFTSFLFLSGLTWIFLCFNNESLMFWTFHLFTNSCWQKQRDRCEKSVGTVGRINVMLRPDMILNKQLKTTNE